MGLRLFLWFWPRPGASIASHSGSGSLGGRLRHFSLGNPTGGLAASRLRFSGASVSGRWSGAAGGVDLPRSRARAHNARIAVGVASGACGAGRGRRAGCGRASAGLSGRLITRLAAASHLGRLAALPSSSSSATTPTERPHTDANRSVLSLRRAACSASAAC